ncbi:hypothetical protein [Cumulibacter manganitolerans]|uniref:hypothetical protein n=1 Tax=Cumulibacter manganitolerans TaxID=1884992 RepID=UPI001298013A|nr:hypothetical protein [Cumulibacter manganitolerans]
MGGDRSYDDHDSLDERSARGLVGGGPSQISRAAAMRARDVDRPSAEDLEEAEKSVHVVHRHWRPR